jgi:hypothetical protein
MMLIKDYKRLGGAVARADRAGSVPPVLRAEWDTYSSLVVWFWMKCSSWDIW